MTGFQTFTFGQGDTGVNTKGKRLKMERGDLIRISFFWWPGLDAGKPDLGATPGFVQAGRHYLKGVGYFINMGPEFTKIAGEPPKVRINTLIIKWPTRSGGQIDAEAIQNGEAQVLYWVMDPDKYEEIKDIHREWHFGKHDLTVKCTDAGFQKMAFTPCKDSVLAKLMEKGPDHALVRSLIEAGQALLPGINDEIGRLMSLDQIKEKQSGGSGGIPGGSPVGDSAATADVDEALDDLLDND